MTLRTLLEELAEKATPGPWGIWFEQIDGKADKAIQEFVEQVHSTDPIGNSLVMLDADGKCPAITGCGPTSADNAALIVALRNNLPTILSALKAVEWVYPKSREDMPAKPGKERYEYVDCLILHKGDLLFRPWNCEHLVFDSEDYDDFFCEWSEIKAYQIVQRPLGPVPENEHGR